MGQRHRARLVEAWLYVLLTVRDCLILLHVPLWARQTAKDPHRPSPNTLALTCLPVPSDGPG